MTVLEGDASVLCVHSNDCHGIVGEVTMVCDADGMSLWAARPPMRPPAPCTGPTKPKGGCKNYLPTDPSVEDGNGLVIVRQTFMLRHSEVLAEVNIERVSAGTDDGSSADAPAEFSCAKLDEGLKSTGQSSHMPYITLPPPPISDRFFWGAWQGL